MKSLCNGMLGDVSIKYMDLSWNNIGGKGMDFLLEMLQNNKSLRKLYIQHNNLEERGAEKMT
jgi:Ran GTPase-activating protein (RanGAP) involved in mRNA processing and transport